MERDSKDPERRHLQNCGKWQILASLPPPCQHATLLLHLLTTPTQILSHPPKSSPTQIQPGTTISTTVDSGWIEAVVDSVLDVEIVGVAALVYEVDWYRMFVPLCRGSEEVKCLSRV
jgi:hypothetical protein